MPGPQSANVHSVDAIRDVRSALVTFQERATTAMGELRQKIDRTQAWLELDRPNYWRDQERRAYDLVASTRVGLETCRLRTVAGRRSDCIEEKKAFEKAKMRMEYVREKQQAVRKWMVQSGREANEYRARTSTFQRMLEHDVPQMIAQLGRMIDAIERYSEMSPSMQPSTSGMSAMVSPVTEQPAVENSPAEKAGLDPGLPGACPPFSAPVISGEQTPMALESTAGGASPERLDSVVLDEHLLTTDQSDNTWTDRNE